MKVKGITIDNGGSELRYISSENPEEVIACEKNISVLDRDMFRIKDNLEEFDIVDIVESSNKDYEGMYATGYGYYLYDGIDIALNTQTKKTNNHAWYKQVLVTIAKDAMKYKLSKLREGKYEANLVDLDYAVIVLIPAKEHSGSEDYVSKLKKELCGMYTAEFPIITEECNLVTFNILEENIGVLPEGVIAITSLNKEELTDDTYSLIIDMGHVTTDIAIFKGKRMLANTVKSLPEAGGTLMNLIEGVLEDNGCISTDESKIKAFTTYKATLKKKEIDLTKDIERTKDLFIVNYIKDDIIKAIGLAGISSNVIQNFIPIGGVLGVKNPDTDNYDLIDKIVEECNLVNAEVQILDEDLRHVNINKAHNFCTNMLEKMA